MVDVQQEADVQLKETGNVTLKACSYPVAAYIYQLQYDQYNYFLTIFLFFFNCVCFKYLFSFLGKTALSFSEEKFLPQKLLWLRFTQQFTADLRIKMLKYV